MHEKLSFQDLFRIHYDKPELLHAQMASMSRQIPLIYLVVSVNIASLSFSFFGEAPNYLTVWIPLFLTVVFVARSIMWWSRPKVYDNHLDAARELKILTVLVALMAIVLSAWCIMLYPYGDAVQKTHIAFFISVTLIGTIFAVVQLPSAAISCLAISGTVFVVFFGTRGNVVYSAMAMNFIMVLAVVFLLVRGYFHNFYGFLNSNRRLSEANEELGELYQELKYHRDNLAQQVQMRTQELEEQKLKLEQSLKAERELNEMQNEFVSMVSHEFRTPLAVIDGMARRVVNRGDSMSLDDVKDRMTKIRDSVTRLSSLVERTLDASRLASGRIQYEAESFNLRDQIFDVIDRHKEIAPDHQFTTDLSRLPATITGDPRLLDHVIGNLISNAVKYSQSNPLVHVTGTTEEANAVIRVRDYGVGIPKADLARVTERFFRAATSTGIQGTGIGLNLVKEIVDMHSGHMKIDSEEGQWTEVTVSLPIAGPEHECNTDVAAEQSSSAQVG